MTDLRGLIGPLGGWGHLSTLRGSELEAFAARVAALGYGAWWVGEATYRDPFAQLGAIARASGPMALGTSIVNVFGRDAMAARMGAMTLHELTGGRFVLGLGVSHPHLVEKLRGHLYVRPLATMREYLEAYRRMPYRGPILDADALAGRPTEPPVLVAALRRRMLELSATMADGALPYLVTASRVNWMRDVLDAAARRTDPPRPRPLLAVTLPAILESDPETARAAARAYVAPYCRAPNYQASLAEQGFEAADWEPPYSERLLDGLVAWGDRDELRRRVAAMHAAGADHVALIPVAADGSTEHLPVLEALAPAG